MKAEALLGLLAEQVQIERESWPKNGRIWPSDLGVATEGGPCALAFRMQCEDEPREPIKAGHGLMLTAGNLVHDEVARLTKAALDRVGHDWTVRGIEERVKQTIHGEVLSGRIDILLEHTTGALMVIDIKTKRGGAFKFLNEPKEGDVLQVQSYMRALNADFGMILYVDREGQNFMRPFEVERDDAAVEDAVDILQAYRDSEERPDPVGLILSRRENKGPDSLYLKVPWQIEWCSMTECGCMAQLPGTPPGGIVAKLKATDEGTEVQYTKAADGWHETIYALLIDTYPDEVFV